HPYRKTARGRLSSLHHTCDQKTFYSNRHIFWWSAVVHPTTPTPILNLNTWREEVSAQSSFQFPTTGARLSLSASVSVLLFIMSTLYCGLVTRFGGRDAVAAALSEAQLLPPLSPARNYVPHRGTGSGELSGEDDPATTPEASTDSENDSSFESDTDNTTRGIITSNLGSTAHPRKFATFFLRFFCAPTSNNNDNSALDHGWPGCSTDNRNEEHHIQQQQQQQQQQKLIKNLHPKRKVRFALHSDGHNQRIHHVPGSATASALLHQQGRGRERRATAAIIQDSALMDVGMMHPGVLVQRQEEQNKQRQHARQRPTFTQRMAWKKRITAAAPFKSTSANINPDITAAATATVTAALVRGKKSCFAVPAPPPPTKRKVSSSSSSSRTRRLRKRDDGIIANGSNGGGGGGEKSVRSRSRPSSRGTVAVPAAVATTAESAAAAAASAALSSSPLRPFLCTAASATATATVAAALQTRRPLPTPTPVDLSCREEVDMDAAMKPQGEARAPICRFLLPCWPEGVEGYEEAGGWRRLGGVLTRETFKWERRCI
ncbi:unnamed protein product, partial [Pylaiella littoralis]